MADEWQLFMDIIIFVLPLWFGNAAPTILGGGPPIDGGRYWRDGKRILGDGKTIRGFWMAVLVGIVVGSLLALIISEIGGIIFDDPPLYLRLEYQTYYEYSFLNHISSILNISNFFDDPVVLGALSGGVMSFGGMVGDMVGSFIKRRSGIPRGKTFIFLDQLGFLVLGMVLVFPIISWPISWLAFLVPITFLTHIAANLFGYFTGIQDDPL